MTHRKHTIFLFKHKYNLNYTSECNVNTFNSDIDKFKAIPQIIETLYFYFNNICDDNVDSCTLKIDLGICQAFTYKDIILRLYCMNSFWFSITSLVVLW